MRAAASSIFAEGKHASRSELGHEGVVTTRPWHDLVKRLCGLAKTLASHKRSNGHSGVHGMLRNSLLQP